MKTRYKVLIWAVLLLGAYVVAGIAAWRIVPGKIAEAERKRPGLTMALAKVANDQMTVSRRVSEITAQTIGNGQDKAAQVSALLGDSTLNRMALVYMGSDWATMYSGFSGNVKHARDLQKLKQSMERVEDDDVDKKMKNLEIRKNQLLRSMETPHDKAHLLQQRQWQTELSDIDRRLSECRGDKMRRDSATRGKSSVQSEVAKTKETIFKLASDYESQTVGKLVQIMANQATALRYEEAEPERLRYRMSFFDIWPLNRLSAMPL